MGSFVADIPELTADSLASCSIGENSSIYLANTSKEIAGKIAVTCGKNCKIRIHGITALYGGIYIFANDSAILDMAHGQAFHGHFDLLMHEPSEIRIGAKCLWGSGHLMTSDCHSIIDQVTRKRLNPAKNISIGNRVWFGQSVKVLKGAAIGNDTVIASCSIVTSGNYPGNSVLAGAPARVVKSGISWDQRLL
jgi:acetyltransferase-like isoleucine patch superfamily enzyme